MIFLIEYDRARGELLTLEKFAESEWGRAENARLEMELDLNERGLNHEVVLLEAESEEALRRTHRRYFENLAELASSPAR